MSKVRILLVIARKDEDRDEIAAKYDKNLKVAPYAWSDLETASQYRREKLVALAEALSSHDETVPDEDYKRFKEEYDFLSSMTEEEYFIYTTEGCTYEGDTAYSTANPRGMYGYPVCWQKRLMTYDEEGPLSVPFKMKDGSLSYVAQIDKVNWDEMHGAHKDVYASAWELCVEHREPKNRQEAGILERMANRDEYFQHFDSKEDYVRHSTSFFTYAVATSDHYYSAVEGMEKDWVANYYDRFIKPLMDDEVELSIYEIVV